MWKHRRAVLERGASGRFGRRGLVAMALFQVLLPLTAPAMDAFLLYGLFFLDLRTTLVLWGGLVGAALLALLASCAAATPSAPPSPHGQSLPPAATTAPTRGQVAAYVDVTLADIPEPPAGLTLLLAFVTAGPGGCTPTWGGTRA